MIARALAVRAATVGAAAEGVLRRQGAEHARGAAGPGRYKVSGVDRASKMDTSMVVTADSAENTKVKGELEGIVVTKVEWQGRR